MRIGIWLQNFEKFELHKCYGQIALGLQEIGCDVTLLTNGKGELVDNNEKVNVVSNINDLTKAKKIFSEFDFVIMYWLFNRYANWVEVAANVSKVIIKCDSSGRYAASYKLIPPSLKFYLKSFWDPNSWVNSLKIITKASSVKFNKKVGKLLYYGFLKRSELASKVIIESPKAATNLVTTYTRLGRYDLVDKVTVIPNPAAPNFTRSNTTHQRKNIIVSVGRWDDEGQKNPKDLIRTLIEFVKIRPSWEAILIGPGEKILKKYITKYGSEASSRIKILGGIENDKVSNYLKQAKIFFSASRWEGFSIAAVEALCSGATLVGPPLEPFEYLVHNGFSGTVSVSGKWEDLLAALTYETFMWEAGKRNPENIANFWREHLDRRSIAQQIYELLQDLRG